MHKRLLVLVLLAMVVACAGRPIAQTRSGRPEVSINTAETDVVRSAIIDRWMATGWNIDDESKNRIQMSKFAEGMSAVWIQMFIGNSYSTTPKIELTFNIYSYGGKTNVVASMFTSTQMAFGKVNRLDLSKNGDAFNEVYRTLMDVKVEIERSNLPKPVAQHTPQQIKLSKWRCPMDDNYLHDHGNGKFVCPKCGAEYSMK